MRLRKAPPHREVPHPVACAKAPPVPGAAAGRVIPHGDTEAHTIDSSQMLYTIAVVLVVLWLLGLVTSSTMGGFIHILLVIAVVMVLLNLISGRKSI